LRFYSISEAVADNVMDNLRVVIADDDEYVSSSLSLMLQNLGYTVLSCARSGIEALDMTRRLRPDLLIMDIKMSDMDGLKASKRILESHPLPIVIVTAYNDPDLVDQADDIGVAGYLVKPFMQAELVRTVSMALSRFRQLRSFKRKALSLSDSIKSRKLIEHVKGLLMERERLSEEEAQSRIQHMSRSQNIAMVKLAEAMLLSESLKSSRHRNGNL
jgi:AmiR/NasT family two-component response regulator